jgi:hypothetical protein
MPYYQVPHYCGIYYYVPHTAVVNVYTNATPSWLPQISLSTDSRLFDTSSRTVLTQIFINPSKTNAIENAKYNFPLYESCAVVAFRCFFGKRLIEGIVKEKEEAKAKYNEAVSRGEFAGLLEQHTPDVFRTSLGNIPPGETIKVEIEYIMELKHDAEVDGLRFTIPTSIAPRYGNAPSGLTTYNDGQPIPGALAKGGMKVSVQITMPSNIRSVQSPSHPISMHLGGHVENVAEDSFNPKRALALLSQSSAELGADFILLVKCADLSSPRALLETHHTISDSRALMVTLVPKFNLSPGPKPEIVFVVDRSGSMGSRMEALKSSLTVFLKSLPVGVKFNICSFGSSHSFLWTKSKPYSADTLDQAHKHVQLMGANMGGTEILPPIKATVAKRYKDIPLEIMLLTDGEVWDTEPLFKYIEKETATGDIRLFSLGIGRDVSHALVEGMARVGRGFAQIVSDDKEGIEGKVVRMLRGGLSAHIKDYRLEWDGRPPEEHVQISSKGNTNPLRRAADGVKKKISLFDKQADTEAPIFPAQSGPGRFSHLPQLNVPTVLQAPYKLPPLFPFSRSTAYVILSGDAAPPSSVWLRGTTPSGDELELEIPVQVLPMRGHTIHQLGARKLLQELEEGTGYLFSGKYGVDKEKNAGTIGDWVEREGIRVSVRYGLASKWTSFVAVRKEKKEKDAAETGNNNNDDEWTEIESVTEVSDTDITDNNGPGFIHAARYGASAPARGGVGVGPGRRLRSRVVAPQPNFGQSYAMALPQMDVLMASQMGVPSSQMVPLSRRQSSGKPPPLSSAVQLVERTTSLVDRSVKMKKLGGGGTSTLLSSSMVSSPPSIAVGNAQSFSPATWESFVQSIYYGGSCSD